MYILIHVVSQTAANASRIALERAGIYASVKKTPSSISKSGCGFCLRILPEQLSRARAVLKESAVKIQGIYEVRGENIRRI